MPSNPSPQAIPSIRNLTCQHCSSVFLVEADLKFHLRTKCVEKQYVCCTCDARFRRLNDLDRHRRIHTGERPHRCKICGRTFSRGTTLSRHQRGTGGCAGRRADLSRRHAGSKSSSGDFSGQLEPWQQREVQWQRQPENVTALISTSNAEEHLHTHIAYVATDDGSKVAEMSAAAVV